MSGNFSGSALRRRTKKASTEQVFDQLLDTIAQDMKDTTTRINWQLIKSEWPEFRLVLDKLIDQARTETDDQTRFNLYKQVRQIVFDDAPIVFAHYETINYLMQKNVVGSSVNPTLELRMQNVGFTTPPA